MSTTKAITIRLDTGMLDRIDAIGKARAERSRFDSAPDRADTVRGLLAYAVVEAEADFGIARRQPAPLPSTNTNASRDTSDARSFGPAPKPVPSKAPAPVSSKAPPPVKQKKNKPEPIDGREIAAWMDARRAEREAAAPPEPQVTCEWCGVTGHDIDHCPEPDPPLDVEPIETVDDLNRLIPETFAD